LSIEKIEKQSVTEKVFNVLREEILNHGFQVGDKFPSEASLSAQFGVSKATIKNALQRLVTLGLIETRVGQGSFVREFDPGQYLDQINDFFLSKSDIHQITEYRMYFEMDALRLAIKKAAQENYEKMEICLRQMDEAVQRQDIILHGMLDYQFHLEICRATGNSIFVMAYEIIGKMLCKHTTILNETFFKQINPKNAREDVHWRLYRAIKAGDIDACRSCYLEMFSVLERLNEEQFKDT
jgi:GntR family transcriptional repressor for pyruvate dehydrogenase complex